jgi:hypothetical protein
MSIFADSLRRLYRAGRVLIEKLNSLRTDGKLTEDEYTYITTL